jgi:hypothetical protein
VLGVPFVNKIINFTKIPDALVSWELQIKKKTPML